MSKSRRKENFQFCASSRLGREKKCYPEGVKRVGKQVGKRRSLPEYSRKKKGTRTLKGKKVEKVPQGKATRPPAISSHLVKGGDEEREHQIESSEEGSRRYG